MRALLQQDGRTLGQGALSWLLTRRPHDMPIPGFRSREQERENAATPGLGPLAGDAMAEIKRLLA
ncbi:hypothetical protein BE11_24525 [Sorangium cellulosum]|nr:hypothetical protein BE11_24525 [Sorangium cellulosum]